jgi:hypothetical protein
MRRSIIVLVAIGTLTLSVLTISAQDRPSLGVFAGAAIPGSNTSNLQGNNQDSFNWGFFVNLPLLQTFDIVPSAELYKFGQGNATDFDLAFKFIVPLSRLEIFAGISPGLTSVSQTTDLHIAGLAGATFRLVSNLDAFVQAKYDYILDSGQNTGVTHLDAGILFNF